MIARTSRRRRRRCCRSLRLRLFVGKEIGQEEILRRERATDITVVFFNSPSCVPYRSFVKDGGGGGGLTGCFGLRDIFSLPAPPLTRHAARECAGAGWITTRPTSGTSSKPSTESADVSVAARRLILAARTCSTLRVNDGCCILQEVFSRTELTVLPPGLAGVEETAGQGQR